MASCCSSGSSLFGVLAIAGLLGIGVAGYTYLAPGSAPANATAVNHSDNHDGCALCTHGSESKVTLASDSKSECASACSEAKAACHGEKTCSEGEKVNAINAANVEKTEACSKTEECAKGDECCKKTGKEECAEKKSGCCSGEKKSESTQPTSGGGF